MRLKYLTSTLCLALAILALPFSPSLAEEKTPFSGEINADNINLRSDATTASIVICILNKGERIEVVSELYDWYKIRLPKKAPAYIKNDLASCINYAHDQITGQPTSACLSAKVLKDRVNIRAKPNESSPIIGIMDKNEIINIAAEAGSWYKIEPIHNSFGWVYKKFVDRAAQASQNKINAPEIQDNNIVLTGIVAPYGMVFLRPATHKLITLDNKIFLLKGNRASLNALNHQKVKVIGRVASPFKAKYPVVEVKIIEVAS